MINSHALAKLARDLKSDPWNPRYTKAMAWEKIVNRRQSVSLCNNVAWAWGGVEEDQGELSLYIGCDNSYYRKNHRDGSYEISPLSYLHETRTSAELLCGKYTVDMDDIMNFCLTNGLWVDSEFLIRITYEHWRDFDGEYDESYDWDIMHVDNALIDTHHMISVMRNQYEYWSSKEATKYMNEVCHARLRSF